MKITNMKEFMNEVERNMNEFFIGINLGAYCEKDEYHDNMLIIREKYVGKINIYIEIEKDKPFIALGEYDPNNNDILNTKSAIYYCCISKIPTLMTIGSRVANLLIELIKENRLKEMENKENEKIL